MKIKFTEEHQYLYVGSILTKKGELVIGFDNAKKKCVFYYRMQNSIEDDIYEIPDEKEYLKYDNIFNYVDNDLLYQSRNIRKLGVSAVPETMNGDTSYEKILTEAVKLSFSELINIFPDCNADNYKIRLETLKYEVIDKKQEMRGSSCFSRWKNTVYIGEECFPNPKVLLHAITHETFHVLGTETETDEKGNIKKKISRNTGFEGRQGFGKGLNEGFINMYANMVSQYQTDYNFETKVAEIVSMILEDDMAYANTKADCSKLMTLTKNREDMITFIKLVDNYHLIYTRCLNKQEGEIELKSSFKHNFISEIEKHLINFFFEHLKNKIKNNIFKTKQSLIDYINIFKDHLVFYENVFEELGLKQTYINKEQFEQVKELFIEKARYIITYAELHISEENEDKVARKFAHELKKVCLFTSKITNIYEIMDESFKKQLRLYKSDRAYMVTEKINENREFYIIKQGYRGNVEEILCDEKEKMKDFSDSVIYKNLNVSEEVREKERRYFEGNTYSIYRNRDGSFGLSTLIDKGAKILKDVKLNELEVPYNEFDDSVLDFSYLDNYVIPDYDYLGVKK